MRNKLLYNYLISQISGMKSGNVFKIGDICKNSKYYNKKDILEIGKIFKQKVLNGKFPNVKHKALDSNNHNIYEIV